MNIRNVLLSSIIFLSFEDFGLSVDAGLAGDLALALAQEKTAEKKVLTPKEQFELGLSFDRYTQAQEGHKDYGQALRCYRLAAEGPQGYRDAKKHLGIMYEEGRGVARNDVEARLWYEKAAAKDCPFSQYRLAKMHETGRGDLTPNLDMARTLYAIAERSGINEATADLLRLDKKARDAEQRDLEALQTAMDAEDDDEQQRHQAGFAQARNVAVEHLPQALAPEVNYNPPVAPASAAEGSPAENSDMCGACMENKIDTVFVPCGHMYACSSCTTKLVQRKCPICRKPFTQAMKFYKP